MSITRRAACAMIPAGLFAGTDLDTGPASGQYSLTSTPEGELLLSWVEAEPQRTLFISRLSGSEWSPRQVIARDPNLLLNWADFPSICALSRDRLAAHHRQGGCFCQRKVGRTAALPVVVGNVIQIGHVAGKAVGND